MQSFRLTLPFAMLVAFSFATGCGSGNRTGGSPQESNLAKLGQAYSLCYNQQRGVPPESEQALRQFLTGLPEGQWQGDLDEMLVSERDGQPYVIFYGKDVKYGEMGMIVGHEAQGVDGKFYLAYDGGLVEEVDAAAIEALKKKKKR